MRTVSIFKNGNNRAIRLPRDLDFEGVSELEIVREGDRIILRPLRPSWSSFLELEKADPGFMTEREDVVCDEGRFNLCTRSICSTRTSARSSCASNLKHCLSTWSSRCCAVTVSWSRPSPTPRCASAPPVQRHRHATCSWLTRSAPVSMPSCPGIALRWMQPRRLRWRCASPARRSVQTTVSVNGAPY